MPRVQKEKKIVCSDVAQPIYVTHDIKYTTSMRAVTNEKIKEKETKLESCIWS